MCATVRPLTAERLSEGDLIRKLDGTTFDPPVLVVSANTTGLPAAGSPAYVRLVVLLRDPVPDVWAASIIWDRVAPDAPVELA